MNTIHFLMLLIVFFGLISIIMAAANRKTRWLAAILTPLMLGACFFGYEATNQLRGYYSSDLPAGRWIFYSHIIEDRSKIYLLAREIDGREPKLYATKFSIEWAKALKEAQEAVCEGKTIVGDGFDEDSSLRMRDKKEKSGDGDETMATPDRPNLYDFEDIQLQRKPSARDR